VFSYEPGASYAKKQIHCRQLLSVIKRHSFVTNRGIASYFAAFPGLREDLAALPAEGHWIDSGGGEGTAISDYYKSISPHVSDPTQRPKTTLITYKIKRGRKPSPSVVLKGRYFDEIADSEIASADTITDLYGIFSYSQNKDVTLKRLLDKLQPGGSLYLYISDYKLIVRRNDGSECRISEWMRSIFRENITIEDIGNGTSIRIRKPIGESPKIPRLELLDTSSGSPPAQIYLELSP
jgi:hypothetical protein